MSANAAGASRAGWAAVSAASQIRLKVVSKGKKKQALNRNGKVKVSATITYTPTGGSPKTQPKQIKLIKLG